MDNRVLQCGVGRPARLSELAAEVVCSPRAILLSAQDVERAATTLEVHKALQPAHKIARWPCNQGEEFSDLEIRRVQGSGFWVSGVWV